MKNGPDLSDADIERSQAFLGAVLGVDEEGNLPPDHQIGANNPPGPIVAPEDQRAADSVANADKWLAEYPVIEDEDVGKAAADHVDQLKKGLKASEEEFKAEKAPHEAKLAEIREKFHPRIDRFKICLRAVEPRFRAWIKLNEDRRKAAEAAEKRKAEEAQRRADQLAEQAKAGGRNAVSQAVLAHEAAQEAEAARKAVAAMPQRAQVRGNLGGRTHSLRTVWRAEIMEQDVIYHHFRNCAEVKDLLQSLANAAARGGIRNPNLPGCEIFSTQE